MKTIIIGWENERGDGEATLVCGFHVTPAEQALVISDAKSKHRFPKGLKRLEQCTLTPIERAIFIATNVGEQIEAAEAAAALKAAKTEKEQKTKAAHAHNVQAAQEVVQSAAKARNELMGQLHNAQVTHRNLEHTPETLRSEGWKKKVEAVKALLLGDPDKKVKGLESKVEHAKKEFAEAEAAYAAIRGGKEPASTANTITGL